MKNKAKERKFQTKDGKFISVFWHYGLGHWVCALYDPSREDKNVVVERHSIHDQVLRKEIKAKTTWYGTSKVSPLYAVRKMRYDINEVFRKLNKEKRSGPTGHDLYMNSRTLSSLKTALGFNEKFFPVALPKTQRGQPYEMLLGHRIITYDSLSNGVIFNEKGDQL